MNSHCVVPESIQTPNHGKSLEIPRGEEGVKAKLLHVEEKYEAKLVFPGG